MPIENTQEREALLSRIDAALASLKKEIHPCPGEDQGPRDSRTDAMEQDRAA